MPVARPISAKVLVLNVLVTVNVPVGREQLALVGLAARQSVVGYAAAQAVDRAAACVLATDVGRAVIWVSAGELRGRAGDLDPVAEVERGVVEGRP